MFKDAQILEDYRIATSSKNVRDTTAALSKSIKANGIKIFSHINHGEEASKANLKLGEVELIVFGDPKVGTYLMQENPLIGIELPLKILVWSKDNQTHIVYPNVLLWQKKFGITKNQPILQKMDQLFRLLADEAAK